MKTVIKMIIFIMLLCLGLGYANHVLSLKYEDIYSMKKFYELGDDTVDVLILGSSHAYADINTGTLWEKHGIASYILAGSSQPMWNTYFYLQEALKTQMPKLVVLEGYRVVETEEFTGDSYIIRNTFGMKWSRNKLDAIRSSAPEERWPEFLMGYTQYHDRYAELSGEDFIINQEARQYENWKGSILRTETTPTEVPDVSEYSECGELTDKTEMYYRAIIELCQEKEIPLLIVISPYAGITEEDQEAFNAAEKIAEEYQVPFLNYNLMNDVLLLDYTTDSAEASHLNYRGVRKLTENLGGYIAEHYEIPDHRGETAYSSWDKDAEYLYALINDQRMQEMVDVDGISDYIIENKYEVILSVDGYCDGENEGVKTVLTSFGIKELGNGGIWYFEEGNRLGWNSGDGENSCFLEMDRHDFGLSRTRDDASRYDNVIQIDGRKYKTVNNGLNIVVFDKLSDCVADSFGLDADDFYRLCR